MEDKKIKNPTLLWLMYQKDLIHWKRMFDLFKEMDDLGSKYISYPIIVCIISAFHYMFAGMHLLFETYTWITNKKQFSKNMASLTEKLINKNLIKLKYGN